MPVVTDGVCADGQELMAGRERVEIERDLFAGTGRGRAAAENRVLLACLRARVVEVPALAVGHRLVVLLDPGQHLPVEGVLEAQGGVHHRVGMGVFGLQVGDDGGVVLGPQPEVVVHELLAVHHVDLGHPLGDRFHALHSTSTP
jgi:hypothetical protein